MRGLLALRYTLNELVIWRQFLLSSSVGSCLVLVGIAWYCYEREMFDLGHWFSAGWRAVFIGLCISVVCHSIYKFQHPDSLDRVAKQHDDDMRSLASRLKKMSFYDSVTHLPNREHFQRILKKCVASAEKNGSGFALYLIYLQGHRSAHEKYGYTAGEEVLTRVADRLKHVTKSRGFLLSRPGTDEFAVVIQRQLNDQHLYRFSQAMLQHINQPVEVNGHSVFPLVSIGVAQYPNHGTDAQSIFASCELALNASKAKGAGQAILFLESMQSDAIRTRILEKKLLMYLADPSTTELKLYYQPKVNLMSGKIEGVEALVRWNDEELGYINPLETFRLAERNSLVFKLTEALLQQAIMDMKHWESMGNERFPVAFNLHPCLLENNQQLNQLLDLIDSSGLPRNAFILEITEDCIMGGNLAAVSLYLQSLVDRGYQLSLDDFGTGFASLTHLKDVPSQEFKIDRSFVLDILENPDSEAIVKALLNIARETNKSAVAEGIETREQLAMLRRYGCQVGQGYLFSPAIPRDELIQLLAEPLPFAQQTDREIV